MSPTVFTKSYDAPPLCEREILRYAGCKGGDSALDEPLRACIGEAKDAFRYRVCYTCLPVRAADGVCDFGVFSLKSEQLAKNLAGCEGVLLFAATVGVGIDRLIAKYGRVSPAKALLFQALGAERIEALCDVFCDDAAKELNVGLRPRFSPGYGDLPLAAQKDIFAVLDCGKRIGLSLNDSLLMSPSKSVTAFAGLSGDANETPSPAARCAACGKQNCAYRGTL